MTPVEKDDFTFALGQTMEFYNKELDKLQLALWVRAMGERPLPSLKRALADYTAQGRYAPKPCDILELVDLNRSSEQAKLPPPEDNYTPCPPDIAAAWFWFLGRITVNSETFAGVFESKSDVSLETQEKYLHVVNHEAKAAGTPDAIPEEYKLREVWG